MNRKGLSSDVLPILILFGGTLIAILLSLGIVISNLNPPQGDIYLLFWFMFISGTSSIGGVYILYRLHVFERFNSLRWTLLANIVLLCVLIFVNVWLTAHLMYISPHDFILTLALVVFGGIVGASCVFFIAGVWINRIAALGQAARDLAAGTLKSRMPVYGNDELAQLTLSFNLMIDGLAAVEAQKRQLEQTRRDLMMWVSHDLRTPLATIRAMNESILDGMVSDPETTAAYIRRMQGELFHLSKMIDDLFALAQMDNGVFTVQREVASLRDLISDTLGGMSAKAKQLHIQLEGGVEAGIDLLPMAADKIQRVLNNLIENAFRHTPAGGRITIQARHTTREAVIEVHNTGSVIAPEDLPHVFESFYRVEPSRAQRDGARGTGLGLAIVRGFVEAHGGKISVRSHQDHGTTFYFTLPDS